MPRSQTDKTAYTQHGQCFGAHETRTFTHSIAGSGRGRRDCRRGAALSSLLIKPTRRMARPPCRHMHRAGAWINPCKPRQGSQCSSCHSTCLIFPCTLPRWLLPAAGRDGLGLVDGLLHRLHHTDSQQRGKATGALPSSPAGVPRRQGSRLDGGSAGAAARADTGRRRRGRVLNLSIFSRRPFSRADGR